MAISSDPTKPVCNVIHCTIEKNNSVALSFRCRDAWFYITADSKDFENDNVRDDYVARVKAARDRQCYVERVRQGKTELRDKAKPSNGVEYRLEEAKDDDSGYSSSKTADSGDDDDESLAEEEGDEERLHAWLQAPLKEVLAKMPSETTGDNKQSISDWYETDIHLYRLKCSKEQGKVEAEQRHDLDGSAYVRKTLTPNTKMPKYITSIPDLQWHSPKDVQVKAASHDIHFSIHPTLVEVLGSDGHSQMCFLKIASTGDESAVKREIKFLHELSKKGLYDKGIRAPRLVGLVPPPSDQGSREHILGFLISLIPQPAKPLTKMMTTKVEQHKRDQWAEQAEQMVATLHKHNMTWGDAKADNFMVDKDGVLWIIDFGGSYTPGWIDSELADTQEGDDMGTGKTVNGLRDPENGTYGDSDEELEEAKGASTRNEKFDEDTKEEPGTLQDDTTGTAGSKRKRRAIDPEPCGPKKR